MYESCCKSCIVVDWMSVCKGLGHVEAGACWSPAGSQGSQGQEAGLSALDLELLESGQVEPHVKPALSWWLREGVKNRNSGLLLQGRRSDVDCMFCLP